MLKVFPRNVEEDFREWTRRFKGILEKIVGNT